MPAVLVCNILTEAVISLFSFWGMTAHEKTQGDFLVATFFVSG